VGLLKKKKAAVVAMLKVKAMSITLLRERNFLISISFRRCNIIV
jgi:hypothetical protein